MSVFVDREPRAHPVRTSTDRGEQVYAAVDNLTIGKKPAVSGLSAPARGGRITLFCQRPARHRVATRP
jgi:hypothetical protein